MDDLTSIKGIGPATAKRLASAGLDGFAALAGFEPGDPRFMALGVKEADLVGWIAEAKVLVAATNNQGKPPRPDDEDDGRAEAPAVPADGGAGDPHSNTPRGSSGTAREASSTDGGTAAETPGVGAQPGSPDLSSDTPPSEKGGGDVPEPGVSTVPPLADDEHLAQWPHLAAAVAAWRAAGNTLPPRAIRIRAKRDGFRRAGMAHTKAPIDHPAPTFGPDALEALLAEPNLVVELV